MTPPVITSITFDKPVYSVGSIITATIIYVPGTVDQTQTFTGMATDNSNQIGQLVVNFTVNASSPTAVTVTDSGSRDWVKVSDTGSVATFTATA